MKVCAAYLERNQKDLDKAITGGADEKNRTAALQLTKEIGTVNEIVDLGNSIRIGTWQSMATRDPQIFLDAEKKFDDVNKKLDELKAGTTDAVDIKQIDDTRAAGKAYDFVVRQAPVPERDAIDPAVKPTGHLAIRHIGADPENDWSERRRHARAQRRVLAGSSAHRPGPNSRARREPASPQQRICHAMGPPTQSQTARLGVCPRHPQRTGDR
jgi:hypothetical protein